MEIKEKGISLKKGEEMGMFEMGSTIVLIFEGPKKGKLHVKEGMKLDVGQPIFSSSKDQ
jgi:phosphatidylserine decarboxylase